MNKQQEREIREINTHAGHCCHKHGCKYGEDTCPVVLDIVSQKYGCEECEELFEDLAVWGSFDVSDTDDDETKEYYLENIAPEIAGWQAWMDELNRRITSPR